jgi:Dyp-type peroxidase family
MTMADHEATEHVQPGLSEVVQANLGRASRFADGTTRDWALFFFFRILPKAEVDKDVARLLAVMTETDPQAKRKAAIELMAAIEFPNATNAGVVAQAREYDDPSPDAPAQTFLDWLKVLTGPDSNALGSTLKENFVSAGIKPEVFTPEGLAAAFGGAAQPAAAGEAGAVGEQAPPSDDTKSWLIGLFNDITGRSRTGFVENLASMLDDPANMAGELSRILHNISDVLSDSGKFWDFFREFGHTAGEAGLNALSGGLLNVCLYELLREMAPALLKADAVRTQPSIMRSEAVEDVVYPRPGEAKKEWDAVPINYTFTYSGLAALGFHEATLASFPDAFKQGMAARAERLGDTGPSAPEYWENVLGLKRVHGYFTGGFLVGDEDLPVDESLWQRLRDDVRAFNDRSDELGQMLRRRLGVIFKLIGLEILHIELGEDPHEVDEGGKVKRLPYRREHFGFRDGISQPFVDMKLGDTAPGGGTPGPNRTWAPVAEGEIYLDRPDEDGNCHELPAHPVLRRGSTFLVFRKLEQDVAGFRIFLAKQRPESPKEQLRLAAQFVGRWPNGTPLVKAPDAPLELGHDPDGIINDFRYAADDPLGRSCPLGAHVRRANPRDIGGTDDVRRHRILRRGMAYGGPFLPEGMLGDGNKRGLLFIAANSRIDLQFEVIQSNWINKGEFLGQAGLARCPLTGANLGGPGDTFLEAGAIAPVTTLPRFVITRGGDYFFAPGLEALRAIAQGCKFEVERAKLPFGGNSLGDTVTPLLFSERRLGGYAERTLRGTPSVIRLKVPTSGIADDPADAPVVFVGQFPDVKQVLSVRTENKKIVNSVSQYRNAARRISRGQDMLVGTEPGVDASMTAKRKRMREILDEAWKELGPGPKIYPRLQGVIQRNIELALRRTGPSHRIDLVHDLASAAVYGVLKEVFGTPGPDWLTELAVALPFSHQHVGDLEPDWLLAAGKNRPTNAGLVTLQVWSILLVVDIIANYAQQRELMALSNQAGSELLTHLDMLVVAERERRSPPTSSLVAAFVHLQRHFTTKFGYPADAYYSDVRMLLFEMASSAMGVIPGTFGVVMGTVLDYDIPLTDLMPVLLASPRFLQPELTPPSKLALPEPPVTAIDPAEEDGLKRLIYETWRINPSLKLLVRRCMQDDRLPSGGKLKANDSVISIIAAASVDPRAFAQPMRFSLWPFLPGPARNLENYLIFGAVGGSRECWGRDALALLILKECIKAAARLEGLGKVAGAQGEAKKIADVVIGLSARFHRLKPDWKPRN